jgi:hypothetical protein
MLFAASSCLHVAAPPSALSAFRFALYQHCNWPLPSKRFLLAASFLSMTNIFGFCILRQPAISTFRLYTDSYDQHHKDWLTSNFIHNKIPGACMRPSLAPQSREGKGLLASFIERIRS